MTGSPVSQQKCKRDNDDRIQWVAHSFLFWFMMQQVLHQDLSWPFFFLLYNRTILCERMFAPEYSLLIFQPEKSIFLFPALMSSDWCMQCWPDLDITHDRWQTSTDTCTGLQTNAGSRLRKRKDGRTQYQGLFTVATITAHPFHRHTSPQSHQANASASEDPAWSREHFPRDISDVHMWANPLRSTHTHTRCLF